MEVLPIVPGMVHDYDGDDDDGAWHMSGQLISYLNHNLPGDCAL